MRSTTTRSERRSSPLIIGGGAAIALLLVGILLLGGGADEASAPTPAPPAQTPPPASTTPATPPPTPAVSTEGLRLYGVAGAGAIIGTGDGGQRLFAIGREVRPGLVLTGVGVDHALLQAGPTTYRLGFDGVAAAGSGAAPGAAPAGSAALREETLRYRLALAPVTEDGRLAGHTVRDAAAVPALARAGLQAGDVIRRINGSEFNGEQLEELAWTLANSSEVRFEITRNGQPLQLTMAR